ncbi:hypothetical protein C0Q70_13014 [Pomacea canaliculata]|uniref:EF-hand domain-containing protein n=1 Tax=Pomacea canaliculata TaxID=400727 RepID=A0A2T7P341_POMCA|nr:hypothetical protein C0Q70_13014 [Pomacea canaliculata]
MKVVILSCLIAAVLGVDYDEAKAGFDALDLDDDGNITIEEKTATELPGTPEIVFHGYFNYHDKLDGAADGVISLSVAPVLFHIFDADGDNDANYVSKLFHATDINNDNLTLEEFGADLIPGSPPLDVESAFKFFDTKDLEENGLLDKSAVLFYFNGLDSNKDGRLTLAEYMENYFLLCCYMKDGLFVSKKRADYDEDKADDGIISIEEIAATQLPGTPEIVIQGTFNYYDKLDGAADGVISLSVAPVLFHIFDANGEMNYDEAKAGFDSTDLDADGVVRPEEMSTFIAKTDTNNDGEITLEDWFVTLPQGSKDNLRIDYDEAKRGFDSLDLNDDGEITLGDWFTTLPQVNDGIENEIVALYAA